MNIIKAYKLLRKAMVFWWALWEVRCSWVAAFTACPWARIQKARCNFFPFSAHIEAADGDFPPMMTSWSPANHKL